jgi:hypothetical protein
LSNDGLQRKLNVIDGNVCAVLDLGADIITELGGKWGLGCRFQAFPLLIKYTEIAELANISGQFTG